MTIVVKRDGRNDPFTGKRIFDAVFKAAVDTGYLEQEAHNIADQTTFKTLPKFEGRETVTVSEIQDGVENVLMGSKYKDIARHYIEYRHDRDTIREGKSKLYSDIDNFLTGTDETYTKENANKSASELVSHRDLIAGIVSKHLAQATLPKDIMKLHNDGGLHVHDLDYFISRGIHNCGVYDFEYMLANGVKLGDIEIETPKSIGTAANVSCQIFSKISGSSYGGQSMAEFDKVMRPYAIRTLEKLQRDQQKYGTSDLFVKDKFRKAIYDACQTLLYQVQTVTGNNGQASFCTISLSLSTDPICKLIKEEYLKCHMNGIGPHHRTPIFPKVIYFVEDGVNLNEGDPNYDEFQLALQCSSKRMYPDYIMAPNNRAMTGGSEEVITPMGCRSFVGKHIENGKEKTTGRFNLGVTTVCLPYAALKAKRDGTDFFDELSYLCDKAFEANMFRVDRLKGTKAKVAPILWQYGALAHLGPDDVIDPLLYGGAATCSIGYAGLYEALETLGDTSKELGMKILKFMKDKTKYYTEKTNISFSIYGSPFENGCYRLTNALRKTFPDWEFDREYITNSFHLPVFKEVDMLTKFDWESDFYMLASGGNVNNIEIPNLSNNIKALEGVVKAAYDKVNYLIINQPVDQCFECGFEGEFVALEDGYHCPVCGNNNPDTASAIRRISGYIHDPLARPANKGKYQEQAQRYKNL